MRKKKIYKVGKEVEIQPADCLDYLRSLPGKSVDLIVTDPAYSGMNNHLKIGNGRIVGEYQNKQNGKWFKEFHDDPDSFRTFLQECYRVLKDNRHIYIMFDSFSLLTLGPVMREVFQVKNVIVWDKVNIGMGHHFRRRHEFILFASKGKRKLNTRSMPDVWPIKRVTRAKYPTQKPVEVFGRMLEASAEPGYTVCDPFVGSGSAAIAALQHDCKFIGADVSRRACTLTAKRAEKFIATGEDELQPEVAVSNPRPQLRANPKPS